MIYIFRIYQFLIAFPLLIVVTILVSIITIVMCIPTKGRFWGYYPPKIWGMLFCWLNFVTVSVKGKDNIDKKTSYVFVANHQGAFDIFAVYGFLGHNFKWMMKASLSKIPFVGFACYQAGHIFVDRGNAARIRHSMEKAEKQLSDGMSIVVFPEGSRSRSGKLGTFKRGAYILATELNLPVVPVTINGSYDIMPRSARLPRPGHIDLIIHRPLVAPAEGHDANGLIEKTHSIIASALPEDKS